MRRSSWFSLFVLRFIGREDSFDGHAEHFCDFECQRQARSVLAVFHRVRRLPRHSQTLRELGLGPVVLRTQHAQAVLHRYLQAATADAIPQAATVNGATSTMFMHGKPTFSSMP